MKSVGSRLGWLVPALLILGGVISGRFRLEDLKGSEVGPAPPAVTSPVASKNGSRSPDAAPDPRASSAASDLVIPASTDPKHRTQIERIVAAMDLTGAPPQGVAQGGRRGASKGVFQNAEGRLPRKARGYWVESDVWPKNGPRDAERLIFGRDREVYWTRDHYETFVRLR